MPPVKRRTRTGPGGVTIEELRADFKDPVTGKRTRPTLAAQTKRAAQEEADALYEHRKAMARAAGAYQPGRPVPATVTLHDLLQAHRDRNNIEPTTRDLETRQARNIIRFAGENTTTSNIDTNWIDGYIDWRRKCAAPTRSKPATDATIMKELKLVSQAMRWGFQRQFCSAPTWRIPRLAPIRKKIRCLTHAELQALFNAIQPSNPLRNIVELYYYTGLRRSELINLEWNNVDLPNARLVFVTKKGGAADDRREDYVFLNDRALAIFAALHNERRSATHVFRDTMIRGSHRRATLGSLNKVISRYAAKAGITHPEQVGVHTLRHTCATHLLQSGAKNHDAAKHLRHRDGGALLLKTYAHALEADIRAATANLQNLHNNGTNPAQAAPPPTRKPSRTKRPQQ